MESVRTPLAWALLREEITEIGSLSDSERLRLAYSYNYLETVFENALFARSSVPGIHLPSCGMEPTTHYPPRSNAQGS